MKNSVKYILNWFPGLSWCLNPCSLEEKQRFCKGPGCVISQPATWLRNKMLSSRSTMSPGDDFLCSVFLKSVCIQFSHSVVSDSLWPHEPQHTRPPCPSQTPGVHPNPCPLSWWCHPTISSSVIPFSSCPQYFLDSGFLLTSNGSALCIMWPKYWSFSFNISPFSEHLGLITFTMDWLDRLPIQGTLKSILQH